jgi:hypothetical protein
MKLGLTLIAALVSFGLFSLYSLLISDLISHVNSFDYNDNERPSIFYYPDRTSIPQSQMDNIQVEIIKSFKNSSGFYKINGTLENQGAIILSDIKVIKYYKVPSVNDTTLVCYEQDIVNCQYKSIDNTLPAKRFFLTMPPAPPETSINPN